MELAAPEGLELRGHGRQTLGPALYVSRVHAVIGNNKSKLFSKYFAVPEVYIGKSYKIFSLVQENLS